MPTTRSWSKQQEAIFRWFAGGSGNLVVRARAGTGKTTTILEATGHAPEEDIVLCAFNKRIADELKTKLANPRASARTLHSIGNGIVMRYWGHVRIDADRGIRLALKAAGGAAAPEPMAKLVYKLAGLGKNMAPDGDIGTLVRIADAYDCVPDEEWETEEGWGVGRVAECASRAMALACEKDGTIDFDDMVYLPVRQKWAHGRFGMVVVDEAQDMNLTQLLLAQKVCRKGGRIVVVGDDRQAIYSFRGADAGSIDRLKTELGATELPLTITYRCPKVVVEYARRLVPDYMAAPSAPEGKMETIGASKLVGEALPGDFILSRSNAPLAKVCLRLLRSGKRARIEGRDIGKGLVALVKKMGAKSIPQFMEKVTRWEARTIARIEAQGRESTEAKVDAIKDQADTLRELAEGLSGPAELVARIESLFAGNGGAAVVCSSVHRAKGLETDRVFILSKTLYCNGKRQGDLEEANIEYVAVTRAKAILTWVEGEV
jgi:superfamily I DNA/RNA helicase